MVNNELIEKLAEIEHEQWMLWAKSVHNEVSSERKKRWQSYYVNYNELPEEVKEQDRVFARKVMEVLDV